MIGLGSDKRKYKKKENIKQKFSENKNKITANTKKEQEATKASNHGQTLKILPLWAVIRLSVFPIPDEFVNVNVIHLQPLKPKF